MPGPPPKPPSERRRRNKYPNERTVAVSAPVDAPPLAATYRVRSDDGPRTIRFLASTRAWYEAWCATPMAEGWLLVHYERLQEIAVLRDQFTRTGEPRLAAELRISIAAFGGTPADMRRLGLHVDTTQTPERARAAGGKRDRRKLFAVPSASTSAGG